MNFMYKGQLDLTDRITIETGLCKGESFKKIAKRIGRYPSTVSHEVLENRTYIRNTYFAGKDCRLVRNCRKKGMCGADEYACHYFCKHCRGVNCTKICDKYQSVACRKPERPPYVCNTCKERKLCIKDKYIYSAQYADAASSRRRSESRQGIRLTDEQKVFVDKLVTRLVRKGQPLTHIYAEHEAEMPISLRSLYNYIDAGELTIKNIDLRRKTSYRQRRKNAKGVSKGFANLKYREGRTYEDFESFMKYSALSVIEMDTVKGVREKGKRLLTMIFRDNSIMLMFLMQDGSSSSVKMVFDFLERGLGTERFVRLFPVFLTDNGSEFKRPEDLKMTEDYLIRTNIFYCDPMASWQKPHIEKNHEFIRYVIPRGKSLNPYTQDDMTLLMNHINSTRRQSLGNKAPYELINEDDEDMWALFNLLKMDLIPPDEVHLMPDLFLKNK
ncbi:Transposase and inactivated derivatives, IS30 family [Acetitomaculum ruminis DSM 5522]|uniref:Transposase and inactivated derivatives, IS30 family n=2 Tax=Acetitomaculum ruminis TaxID=2382 RepID=A0A1I0Y6W8_9FIRM|nr:Transposase and inactivated derivatives, IS30 family [Acetitomaculum ruminis DSM 5522]